MDSHVTPPASGQKQGRRGFGIASLGLVAVAFTIIGILIASNLDLPSRSVARTGGTSTHLSALPVVQQEDGAQSPFVRVVENVQQAVVNISARSRDDQSPWWYYSGGYSTQLGSGFFFREDGYILTNSHVVSDALQMTVRTASGYEYEAQLVGSDPATDLAVVKIEPEEEISTIPFGNSENIRVGDWAIAIGNPFPQAGLDRTVTVGVVSAVGRNNLAFGEETPFYQNYIQTDASINPGNSGGPLLNINGECIGVNAAISSPTGSSVGIGFAIPINMARAIVPDLIATGQASRGWLGVWLSDVTEREAKRQGMEAVMGVRIDSVYRNSPAHQAGLQGGDIVVGFNDKEVSNGNQFIVMVSTVDSGTSVPVEVVRDGEKVQLRATVADRDNFLASQGEGRAAQGVSLERWLGMELVTFSQRIADEIGIEHVPGLLVTRVFAGSPADRASITEGTIILQIGDDQLASLEDLRRLAGQRRGDSERIPIIVQEPDGNIARKVLRP